ncbi:DUF6081 family protein [Micromonospora sp. NPDC005806]|uniref:DUF6081 family protein n=1 Tax=Micromonospora sp. NPDC005806 TaxID=3364234 RepID=UPI0036783A4B
MTANDAAGNQRGTEWSTYDDFASGDLSRWSTLEVPLGAEVRRHEEPNEIVRVAGGAEVDVPRFSLRFDGSHMLDDPKHAYVSRALFALPDHGTARFAVEMSAQSHHGNAHDFRDGVAIFNVVNMSTGTVFDFATSGERIWALHEQLPLPNVAPENAFTYLIEAPFAGTRSAPGHSNQYVIELDTDQPRARWFVDGKLTYTVTLDQLPDRVGLGFGLFTLHPQAHGRSTSIRGQGMRGAWRSFRFANARQLD